MSSFIPMFRTKQTARHPRYYEERQTNLNEPVVVAPVVPLVPVEVNANRIPVLPKLEPQVITIIDDDNSSHASSDDSEEDYDYCPDPFEEKKITFRCLEIVESGSKCGKISVPMNNRCRKHAPKFYFLKNKQ